MSRRLRLCMIAPEYASHPPFGGIATYVRDAAQWLVANGHDVHVVCVNCKGFIGDEEESCGVHVHYVAPQRIKPRRMLHYASKLPRLSYLHEAYCGWNLMEISLGAWLAVRRLTQNAPFDLVECTDFGGLAFWGLWPVHRARILLRGHGILHLDLPFAQRPGGEFHRYLEKVCADKADFILTVSDYLAQCYRLELNLEHQRINSWPWPFDFSSQDGLCKGTKTPGEPLTILYVGRMEYPKGVDLLFEAMVKAQRRFEGFRCYLIGAASGEFQASLETFLSENREWVSHLGALPQHEVFQHMSKADVLILPSRTETLPRSLVEAASFGLPQIATHVGGIPEIVEDGVTGLLVEPDNSDALAEAVLKLCASPDVRAEMGQKSRERALEKFEISKVMSKQVQVYQALVEGESPNDVLGRAV